MAYFDEDGNEVKGLLTEEEAKKLVEEQTKSLMETAAREKIEAETRATQMSSEVENLKKEIDAAKSAPAGGAGQQSQSDKDENLANLRRKLEETESSLKAEREATAARFAAIEGDKIAQAINAIANGDEKLADKIRYNYEKTLSGVQALTAEEVSAKVQSAFKLSVNSPTPNPLDAVLGGAAPQGGARQQSPKAKDFTPGEAAIGSKLGISDADRAKYGNDPRLLNMNTK